MTECNIPVKKRKFVKDILRETSKVTGFPEKVILGPGKARPIVYARHKFLYDCVDQLKLGFSHIARVTGFDHTTVIYGTFWHAKRNGLPELTEYQGENHLAYASKYQAEKWRSQHEKPNEEAG